MSGVFHTAVYLKPINKQAARGLCNHSRRKTSLRDIPTSELSLKQRERIALGERIRTFGLTESSSLYLFLLRVFACKQPLPRFSMSRLRDRKGEVISSTTYQLFIKGKSGEFHSFNSWSKRFGYVAKDATGSKDVVASNLKRIVKVMNGLNIPKSILPKKDPLWASECRTLKIAMQQ